MVRFVVAQLLGATFGVAIYLQLIKHFSGSFTFGISWLCGCGIVFLVYGCFDIYRAALQYIRARKISSDKRFTVRCVLCGGYTYIMQSVSSTSVDNALRGMKAGKDLCVTTELSGKPVFMHVNGRHISAIIVQEDPGE